MISTFVKLSLRKIWKDLSFSLLSITGLSLAAVSCTVILLYVTYERSFDGFRSDDLYRVTYHGFQNNAATGSSAQIVPALAPALEADIPEVIAAARVAHTGPFMADPVIQYQEKKFRESRIYYADDGFLTMFSYPMISGVPQSALDGPARVVLSKSAAGRYFGSEDPVGKSISFHRGERGTQELTVTGVFEDVPGNSHIHTDFVVSFSSLGFDLDSDWDWGNFYTYILLQPGVNETTVESKIPSLLDKHAGQLVAKNAADGFRVDFLLQPVQSIHLESKLWGELEVNGDARTIDFLSIIAVFILLIAWINYINFSIARAAGQSKEISIKKINGSSRLQLIGQLLTDSALVNLFAVLISVAFIQASLPVLKFLIGLPEEISFGWRDGLTLIMIFIAGTLCSGLYPAIFISRLNPISLLKSKITRSAINLNLNKSLIIFQFTATVVLIIGTITVFRQLSFMRNKELGLNLEQTLIVKGPAVKDSLYESTLSFFTHETKNLSGVSAFALSSSIPGEELHWGRSYAREDSPQHRVGCSIVAIDENFFDLFNAEFVAGNNYPDATPMWQDAIIINESAARELGFADASQALEQSILWHENGQQIPKKVIGVVKDFNQQSLRNKVEPIVFTLKKYIFAPWAGEFYAFKIDANKPGRSIEEIQNLWTKVYPQNPFDYFFLDEYFNAQYKNDERFGKVFSVFSVLAIFIASLGLFGLTAYMTAMRTKEIGIRKVLGSSAFQLVRLLSTNYVMLVLISFAIGCPIALFLMNGWLAQFAYRIPMDGWIFLIGGVICLSTALLTVGGKCWHSANMNPVKALKDE